MKIKKSSLLLLLSWVILSPHLFSQSVNITGLVTDAVTSQPITGAWVKINGSTGEAITGADGRYSIQTTSIRGEVSRNFQNLSLRYSGQRLSVNIHTQIHLSINILGLKGKKLQHVFTGSIKPGSWALENVTAGLGSGMYVLSLFTGTHNYSIKLPVLTSAAGGKPYWTSLATGQSTALAKTKEAAVTVIAWAAGYAEVATVNETGTGEVNFSLAATAWSGGTIASLGTPFNAADDGNGPNSHMSMYGRKPDIVGVPRGDGSVYAAWQNAEGDNIVITRVIKQGGVYKAAEHLSPATLPMLGGLVVGADQTLYFYSGDWNDQLEAVGEGHTPNMLMLHKYNGATGQLIYDKDIMLGLQAVDGTTLYKPFDAGNGRIAVGNGTICLLLAHETLPAGGHQLTHYITVEDATGTVIRDFFGQSHSFDERMIWDGTRFIGYELGDSNIRAVTMNALVGNRLTDRPVFAIKGGDTGEATGGGYNNTFTRLGGLQMGPSGYVVTLATEILPDILPDRVNSSRNMALLHVRPDFEEVEQVEKYGVVVVDTKEGNVNAVDEPVHVHDYWDDIFDGVNPGIAWLSHYTDKASEHAERPKLVRIADNVYIAMWEKWTLNNDYVETWAVTVDEYGNILVPAKNMGQARLSRGDDLFALDGKAAWFNGGITPMLVLYTVDSQLNLVKHDIQ